MRKGDLPHADLIMRLAFGTFRGAPDPSSFMGDADYVFTRFAAEHEAAFVAEFAGRVVGSNFATNWGTVGFFGPLTVHPDFQSRGVGKALMEPVMESLAAWGTRLAGLYTFANSAKHVGLYQRFGFYPRFLTAIMELVIPGSPRDTNVAFLSRLRELDRESALTGCRVLTNRIYDGLDLTHEIAELQRQSLGEVVLLDDEQGISGAAVCHYGPRTEAGSGVLYIKFGAVRSGPGVGDRFARLLDGCEELARVCGLPRLRAGVNLGRVGAYEAMLRRGYRTVDQGVAMHRPNEPGYSRPEIYVVDDWR